MDELNGTVDSSRWTNATDADNDTVQVVEEEERKVALDYIIVPAILMSLCIVAVVINARILICVRWIRRPLSPILQISLSLAVADVLIAALLGTGLLFNSLLPFGLHYDVLDNCGTLTLEAFRLSAILITTTHLLALAGNHYLGILCPFKSMRWMTHTNTNILTAVIWVLPTLYIFAYFSSFENQGYRVSCDSNLTTIFITKNHFRKLYSAYLFIPLIIMLGIYFHISIIVRRHQANRRWFNRHSRRNDNRGRGANDQQQQQQFDRNLKAIWTTLLILSTYLICFMPSVLFFALACDGCYFEMEQIDMTTRFVVGSINQYLLITKPLLNPLIYASRMHEIRAAMRRMNIDCRHALCPASSRDDMERTYSSTTDGTHMQLVSYASGSTRRNHCSISSVHVGNGFARGSRRTENVTADL